MDEETTVSSTSPLHASVLIRLDIADLGQSHGYSDYSVRYQSCRAAERHVGVDVYLFFDGVTVPAA